MAKQRRPAASLISHWAVGSVNGGNTRLSGFRLSGRLLCAGVLEQPFFYVSARALRGLLAGEKVQGSKRSRAEPSGAERSRATTRSQAKLREPREPSGAESGASLSFEPRVDSGALLFFVGLTDLFVGMAFFWRRELTVDLDRGG